MKLYLGQSITYVTNDAYAGTRQHAAIITRLIGTGDTDHAEQRVDLTYFPAPHPSNVAGVAAYPVADVLITVEPKGEVGTAFVPEEEPQPQPV